MSQTSEPAFTVKSVIINIILTGLVFCFFTYMLRPFVPDDRPVVIWIVSAYTSVCVSGVFFFAVNMFTVVLKDQRKRARESKDA